MKYLTKQSDPAGATSRFWQHDVYQLIMAIILIGGATIGATSQVLNTLPHIVEGVEYDYMPHDGIDYLPYALATDPDSLFNQLYMNSLILAGMAESAYFQNEEWQHECRLDSQRVIDFYLDYMRPMVDTVKSQWDGLRDIQTDPIAIDNFNIADPFAQRALSDVRDAIDGYLAIMLSPAEKCDTYTPQLNGYTSDMVRSRYFFEQIVLGIAPYYNRDPKNPLN